MQSLDPALASTLAGITLGHVRREYPHSETVRSQSALDEPRAPQVSHPIFFGSYDWHSCVHGHWLLARLLRRCPDSPEADRIIKLFNEAYTEQNVAGELAFFRLPGRAGFERPYGWCWLLKLYLELQGLAGQVGQSRAWHLPLQPLAQEISERLGAYLPRLLYPIRSGTHNNTAFALLLALDYANACDEGLHNQVQERARAYFANDRGYQGWEPGGEDFLSPGWQEALLMHRTLGADFTGWFDAFLPELTAGRPAALLAPVRVSDRSDGRLAHLDGLNLSRAWCMGEIASALPSGHASRQRLRAAAEEHLQAGAAHLQDDYMGEHWLATFLLLALDGL